MNNSILNEKPVFELKIHAFGTRYDLLVNGILAYKQKSSRGQVTLQLPINHWMRSGENTLELIVYPKKKGTPISEESEIKAALYVRNANEKEEHRIGGFVFKGIGHLDKASYEGYRLNPETFERNDDGIIEVTDVTEIKDTYFDGVYEFSQTFDIPSNLPLWKFFESDDVPEIKYEDESRRDEFWDLSKQMVKDLLVPIQDAILAGDLDSIMPLFEERNRETDQAFYKEPGTTERELRYTFTEDIKDLNMKPLTEKQIGYEYERGLKLTGLYGGGRGGAIGGDYKDGGGSLSFPIIFRLKDGKWIITR
ncbi:MAG: hypothetical protein JKY50_06470 [Oleispira sp.]|nr:hypothetical protein [Oleispira sp.]MBL4881815.1 hypothetical protein [Oleispira sp.]